MERTLAVEAAKYHVIPVIITLIRVIGLRNPLWDSMVNMLITDPTLTQRAPIVTVEILGAATRVFPAGIAMMVQMAQPIKNYI